MFGAEQALTGDEPVLPAIAADDMISSAATTYGTADPDEVVAELARQATLLADAAAAAGSEAWSRGITIGDERIDVRALLEHALHDSRHHLVDVTRGLALLRTPSAGASRAKAGPARG